MKLTTGSSSSSLASDSLSRKSTFCFYTDSDFLNGPEKMEANTCSASCGSGIQEDVISLKREVTTLHNALQLQSSSLAREQMRAVSLAARLAQVDTTKEAKRSYADKQAASLLRGLLVLEAALRKERIAIVQKLQLKDLQIQRQKEEIEKLKSQRRTHCANCQQLMGFTSEQTNIETDPEFHSLESVSCRDTLHQSYQKNSRIANRFVLPKSENSSSSEEVFEGSDDRSLQGKNSFMKSKQPFVRKDVTRRSRKYSFRKQSSVNSETSPMRQVKDSSSSAEDGAFLDKDRKFQIDNKEDFGDAISKDIQRASNRMDALLNNPHHFQSLDVNIESSCANMNPMLREQIENKNGILNSRFSEAQLSASKAQNGENDDAQKPWYTNVSDPDQSIEFCPKPKLDKKGSLSVNDIFSSFNNKHYDENRRRNGDPFNPTSVSSMDLTVDTPKTSEVQMSDGKSKSCDGLNNNMDVEPNENWYASASDPDDEQSCEIYKNNPVLECVNQILLQNSLDEISSGSHRTYESPSPKSSNKKVQFSTLNSISFDENVGKNGPNNNSANNFIRELERIPERRSSNKIVKFSLETASEHSYEVPVTSEGFNYEIQSIYSNDYEPIITQTRQQDSRPVPMPRSINNINKNESPPSLGGVSSVRHIAQHIESKLNGNHYVDMDIKPGNHTKNPNNKRKLPRFPPALPPKPKNLVSKSKLNTITNSALAVHHAQSSDSVGSNQRSSDVHSLSKSNGMSSTTSKNDVKHVILTEPDYCSISEINVPVVSSGMRALISTQPTVELHAEKFSSNFPERRSTSKLATISKIVQNKIISDKDIPKLPLVTEIIIPDEDDISEPPKIPMETFPGKTLSHIGNKLDLRNSIQIGHSVSTILTDIKIRNASIEEVNTFNTKHETNKISGQKQPFQKLEKTTVGLPLNEVLESDCEKFDLSQNFEEFKIDDCEFAAEEYRISSSDGGSTDENIQTLDQIDTTNTRASENSPAEGLYKIEFTAESDLKNNNADQLPVKFYSRMTNKPDLLSNIENVETDSVRYSDIESSNSSSSNCGSYNTVKCEPSTEFKQQTVGQVREQKNVPFEYFLESSGLCSKSILTPSRPLSTGSLRGLPRREAGRAAANTAIKYFEPYL